MRILYLTVLFLPILAFSQDKVEKTGVVYKDNEPVEGALITTKNTRQSTITDLEGFFKMKLSKNDTLQVNYLGKAVLTKPISETDMHSEFLEINLAESINELDEVFIENRTDINAVSLGISRPGIVQPTTQERRLQTAGDFKAIHLLGLLAGSLQVDPIINKINGKTKRLKGYIEIEQTLENRKFLEENFGDYLKKSHHVSETELPAFLVYVVEEKEVKVLIAENNESLIKIFLVEKLIEYRTLQD